MGASESIEVKEHHKITVCVKNSDGSSRESHEDMQHYYKYHGEITKIPKIELRSQAPKAIESFGYNNSVAIQK